MRIKDIIVGKQRIKGRVRPWRSVLRGEKTFWLPSGKWQHNEVLYSWSAIASQLLVSGNSNYRINGMYLEFQNVGSPSDTVTPPTFDRTGGIDYYLGLNSGSSNDYLRVPMAAGFVTSSNTDLFPVGNVLNFFAQSQGTMGVNEHTFSSGVNSVVFGGALVAMPVQADRTQDIVFSRFYFDTDNQQIKLASSQLGIQWLLSLE